MSLMNLKLYFVDDAIKNKSSGWSFHSQIVYVLKFAIFEQFLKIFLGNICWAPLQCISLEGLTSEGRHLLVDVRLAIKDRSFKNYQYSIVMQLDQYWISIKKIYSNLYLGIICISFFLFFFLQLGENDQKEEIFEGFYIFMMININFFCFCFQVN